jgi:thimet oligopeptidase
MSPGKTVDHGQSAPAPQKSSQVATLGEFPFSLSEVELRRRTDEAIGRAQGKLDKLLDSKEPPTVENLLNPLNLLLAEVSDMSGHGDLLIDVHPEEGMRTAGRHLSEAANRFLNAYRLNDGAYRALKNIPLKDADATTRFALQKMLREMRRAGVELDKAGRERILAITNELDQVSNQFAENIANAERFIEVNSPGELKGVPPDYLASHPPNPDGKIKITTSYPDLRPVMGQCADQNTRQRLWLEFIRRAFPENVPVLERLLSLRHELARSLGYPTYAAYAIEDKMLRTPEDARKFLERLGAVLKPPTERELQRLLERKRRDYHSASHLENWDLASTPVSGYYVERIRTEEYGVDTKLLSAYLPYVQVRDGLFKLCSELFGITIFRNTSADVWHPTVEVYDVVRGTVPLGRFFLDLVPREGKYDHARTSVVRVGLSDLQLPQGALTCNFLAPNVPVDKVRMQYDDVIVFFHEFGHLLHVLFSGHGRWLYNSMFFAEFDFIEAPSQLFEEWARDPATLGRFARNPDTGEAVPASLLERLEAAQRVGRPTARLQSVGFSMAAIEMHDRDPKGMDIAATMKEAYSRYFPIPLEADYFPGSWGHVIDYGAFFYTYSWSLVIARDLLRPFLERKSLTDPEIAERYVTEILAPGSTRPAAELIRKYLGRDFDFAAFEQWVSDEHAAR